jgi:hypothetical protein
VIESVNYANSELEWFKLIEPKLPKEVLDIIRLELISAYRAGYSLAVENNFSLRVMNQNKSCNELDS